jgi:Tol biopolymer transport system component
MLFYEQTEIVDEAQCKHGKFDYWLLNLEKQEVQEVPVEFQKDVWDFHWTPDGKRLIFFHDSYIGHEHQLWSMYVDGSDLKPVLADVDDFIILSNEPQV